MKRTTCSACGYDDLKTFLDLGMSPIADAYTDEPHESSATYPLQLAVCSGCHLVQLLEVVDQKTLFGTGYSFYSSASPPLSLYHETYARSVIQRHEPLVEQLVVEIGCNDGDMLRHFARVGNAIGVDPSGGPVEKALSRGLNVLNEPFTSVTAHKILDTHGPAGVVVANHVLAHVESVSEVLHGISELLDENGVAYVEVQYLPDLLTNNAFDLVYHEHRNFFSLTSLASAAARWGLIPVDAQLTDRQGGSLRVKFSCRGRGIPLSNVQNILTQEEWLRSVDVYGGVQGRVNRIKRRLREMIYEEMIAHRHLAVYGAPAKATTLLNFCDLDSEEFDFVVDSTYAKQGRFVPGTALKIVAPSDPCVASTETFLVTSWNYARTIIRNHESEYGTCRWIVPIPAPVLL